MASFSRGASSITRSIPILSQPTSTPYLLFRHTLPACTRQFSQSSPLASRSPPPPKINPKDFIVYKQESPKPPTNERRKPKKNLAPHKSKNAPEAAAAATTAALASRNPEHAKPAPGPLSARIAGAYAIRLAQKDSPTALYEAPSQIWHSMGAVISSSFCFAWTGYNILFHVMYAPADAPSWVIQTHAGACAIVAGMGTYFLLSPSRTVTQIRAIPATAEFLNKKSITEAAKKSNLLVEVTVRRILPGLPLKKVYVTPDEIMIPKRLSAPHTTLTRGELAEVEKRAKAEREAEIRYDKARLMTAPFRQTGRAFRELWRGIRRALTRDGFSKVKVAGKMYKLDMLGGWAAEDGKALDRLVIVEGER